MDTGTEYLLSEMVQLGASDCHVTFDGTCFMRLNGTFMSYYSLENPQKVFEDFQSSLDETKTLAFQINGDTDCGLSFNGHRFRIHFYRSEDSPGLVIRQLPETIPTPEELGLPGIVKNWSTNSTGLVIVTGPTGSGKSTTLASLTNQIHQTRSCNIVTIEDPVEFHFPSGLSKITHREIGTDSPNFARAVRAGLREDVDVMVIGEMRDTETIEAAISLAEGGHLVFATMHTHSASQAIDRLIDAFPNQQQSLARSRLSTTLLGVVYQRLLPAVAGGRVAAFEVLAGNSAIRNLIREGKTYQMNNVIEMSRSEGMCSMEVNLKELYANGFIDDGALSEFRSANV